MNRTEFSDLIFNKRRKPDDFDAVIRFNAKIKSTLQLEMHWFISALSIHALDLQQSYSAIITEIADNFSFNLRHALPPRRRGGGRQSAVVARHHSSAAEKPSGEPAVGR